MNAMRATFREPWNRERKAADTTDSAYEYHLAKACSCCGLDPRQTECVVLAWRQKHGCNALFGSFATGSYRGLGRKLLCGLKAGAPHGPQPK